MGKTRPVLHSDAHETAMDVVKFLGIRPLGFDVIDFKFDILGDPNTVHTCHYILRAFGLTIEAG